MWVNLNCKNSLVYLIFIVLTLFLHELAQLKSVLCTFSHGSRFRFAFSSNGCSGHKRLPAIRQKEKCVVAFFEAARSNEFMVSFVR